MAEPDIKRLPISEFRDRGYLHEVNRLVLHPLGLALSVNIAVATGVRISMFEADHEEALEALTQVIARLPAGSFDRECLKRLLGTLRQHAEHVDAGDIELGGVWDYQDDPQGIVFAEDTLDAEKAERVCQELLARRDERKKHTGGWVTQPLPESQVLSTTYTDPELRSQGGSVVEPGKFAGVELPEDEGG